MVSQKIKNNASISYFFLGWLFLLAKNNPNFSEPFVRAHAKHASKGHALFFIIYFAYSIFLSQFFSYTIPVIEITVNHIIEISIFVFLTFFIISGVYSSQKKDETNGENIARPIFGTNLSQSFEYKDATEGQRMTFFLSYIPFLGMLVAEKNKNTITTTGARISSLFAAIFIINFIAVGYGSLSTVLLFFFILGLVFLSSRFFLFDEYSLPGVFEKIPSIESLYVIIRAIPLYIGDIIKMMFGKTENISLQSSIETVQKKDEFLYASLSGYFTDESLPFSKSLLYIPFVNIIFIPKILGNRTSKYVLAIGQGLVLTFLMILVGFFSGFTSSYFLLFLFPIFYASASRKDFLRIPFIYEIYVVCNTLTFGLLKNKRRLEEIQGQDKAVSFKV